MDPTFDRSVPGPNNPDHYTKRVLAAALGQDFGVFRQRIRDLTPLWHALTLSDRPRAVKRRQGAATRFLRFEDAVLAAIVATLKLKPRDVAHLYQQLARRDDTYRLDARGWKEAIWDKDDGRVLYVPLDGTQPVFAYEGDRLDLKIRPWEFAQLVRKKLEQLARDNFDLYFWGRFPRPETQAAAPEEEPKDQASGKVKAFRKR